MTEEQQKRRVNWGWGIPASILLHAVFAFVLFFHIPFDFEEPQKEEAVNVEMVAPPEEKAEEQKKPEEQEKQQPAPRSQEIPPLDPVFEFGEKDQGPRQDNSGTSAQDSKTDPQIVTAAPTERPQQETESRVTPALTKAKTLFSREMTNDPVAIVALESMPRNERANQLCSTELGAQIHMQSYNPQRLPIKMQVKGNLIEAENIGFESRGKWYDLSFRCEVDAKAMKVVLFGLHIGGEVPKAQWKERGFVKD